METRKHANSEAFQNVPETNLMGVACLAFSYLYDKNFVAQKSV